MSKPDFFCNLTSSSIAALIRTGSNYVCYAGPGIQLEPAEELAELARCIGPEMVTVNLDFDERVMRMGYGDIKAVRVLREAEIQINNSPGLRTAIIIVDDAGFTFTPTPLYLEAETSNQLACNALRLSTEQIADALVRLSPAAKAIAVARTSDPVEKKRFSDIPVEVDAKLVDDRNFSQIEEKLASAPPVKFDLARRVRVFEPYLQYVELSLSGVAIERHRLAIPKSIQMLGSNKDLEGRLRTTYDLIQKGSELSPKDLENELTEIRKNFTPSLGKEHGRVVLKAVKPILTEKISEFRKHLEEHQNLVKDELQKSLDESRDAIIAYYMPLVMKTPPDGLLGQSISGAATEEGAKHWLSGELNRVFPSAELLIKSMRLEERYKDVTYETLSHKDFLKSVKEAFPLIDWDNAYEEFCAAGETLDTAK